MIAIAWGLGLAGLTLIFGNWEARQYNPNQNLRSSDDAALREVTLRQNRQNHYVASGTINNIPVVFMLDTGATAVAVPARLAGKLGLKPGAEQRAITANGSVIVRTTVIDRLALGSIELHDIRASINPGMTGNEVLLGMSALKNLDFNQSDGRLTLRQTLR